QLPLNAGVLAEFLMTERGQLVTKLVSLTPGGVQRSADGGQQRQPKKADAKQQGQVPFPGGHERTIRLWGAVDKIYTSLLGVPVDHSPLSDSGLFYCRFFRMRVSWHEICYRQPVRQFFFSRSWEITMFKKPVLGLLAMATVVFGLSAAKPAQAIGLLILEGSDAQTFHGLD